MTSRNVFSGLVALRDVVHLDVAALRTVASENPAVVTVLLLLFAKCVRLVADDAPESDVHDAVRQLLNLLGAVRDRAAERAAA